MTRPPKRYCDAVPVRDWVMALLERLDVPASTREPVHVDALTESWRRVMEEQMVEHFNVAELAAVARFYSTPEAQSLMHKMVAFTTLVTPMLEAEVYGAPRTRGALGAGPGRIAESFRRSFRRLDRKPRPDNALAP